MNPNAFHAALLERYGLDREAARTEAGVLYDATEKATLRKVSIEIANDLDDDARLEFERDAMISQRLEGEHVLRVLDVGALLDGTPFVVREPALGSLASDVSSRGRLPTAEAVAWTLEVCEALAEAHTKGIAHGDIRAETVFLGRDDAGHPIAKVRWTSKAKAEGTAREDVARDIAGAAFLLRYLITGQTEADDDAVKTLPTELGHAVARATSKSDDNRYRNIGELAAALARYAPPEHQSARNIAFLMSRAGIVGSPVSIPVSQRMTAPNPIVPTYTPPTASAISAPPPSSRRAPISARLRGEPGLNEEWFAPPPTRPRRSRISDLPAAPPERKTGAFAAVALLLLGATLGGTLYLYKAGELPQWSGAAPPSDEGKMEPLSRTEVTSALMDTTIMTPPPALEGAPLVSADQKPVTTKDDDIEVTESRPEAQPPVQGAAGADSPSLGSGPAMPPSSSKAKAAPAKDEDTPAQPWAGTATPSTPSPAMPSSPATDESAPSAPSTSPTSAPTTPSTEEPRRIIDDPGF